MSLESIRREFKAIQELRQTSSVLRFVLVLNASVLAILAAVCFMAGITFAGFSAVAGAAINAYFLVVA